MVNRFWPVTEKRTCWKTLPRPTWSDLKLYASVALFNRRNEPFSRKRVDTVFALAIDSWGYSMAKPVVLLDLDSWALVKSDILVWLYSLFPAIPLKFSPRSNPLNLTLA